MHNTKFALILTLSFCVAANAFPGDTPDGSIKSNKGTVAVDHDKQETTATAPSNRVPVDKEKPQTGEHASSQDVKPTPTESRNGTVTDSTPSSIVPPVIPGNEKTTKKPESDTPTPKIQPTTSSTTSTTTPAPVSSTSKVTTTAAPVTTDHSKIVSSTIVPAAAARGFDGASFVGGIILSLGLMAVGYLGFKYYKKSELNYHTL